MYRIKLLILLSSLFLQISCVSTKMLEEKDSGIKYSINHLSGGEIPFQFSNILKQKLISFNLYEERSLYKINLKLGTSTKNIAASVNKVSNRKIIKTEITKMISYEFDEEEDLEIDGKDIEEAEVKECKQIEKNYVSQQSFLIANSTAEVSNIEAENNILDISMENIADEMIDDLFFYKYKIIGDCLIIG